MRKSRVGTAAFCCAAYVLLSGAMCQSSQSKEEVEDAVKTDAPAPDDDLGNEPASAAMGDDAPAEDAAPAKGSKEKNDVSDEPMQDLDVPAEPIDDYESGGMPSDPEPTEDQYDGSMDAPEEY